jgi:hypothetical protein
MSYINFENYINEKSIHGNEKLTIVIGSGFHKQAFYQNKEEFNILTNWCCLLKEVSPKISLTDNYLLDFERYIIEETNCQKDKSVSKIENKNLVLLADKLKKSQNITLESLSEKYPIYILNPKYVSDVISLNFDTVAEELFKLNYKKFKKCPNSTKNEFFINPKTNDKVLSNSIYFNQYTNGSDIIKFWYPHGNIKRPTSLILSIRKYSTHLKAVEALREKMKKDEREHKYDIPSEKQTWFSQLVHTNVLILGASISYNEWDLWSALVARKRNYAKAQHLINEKYIFQLKITEKNESVNINTKQLWFNPICSKNLEANEQWEMISKLLSK